MNIMSVHTDGKRKKIQNYDDILARNTIIKKSTKQKLNISVQDIVLSFSCAGNVTSIYLFFLHFKNSSFPHR